MAIASASARHLVTFEGLDEEDQIAEMLVRNRRAAQEEPVVMEVAGASPQPMYRPVNGNGVAERRQAVEDEDSAFAPR